MEYTDTQIDNYYSRDYYGPGTDYFYPPEDDDEDREDEDEWE